MGGQLAGWKQSGAALMTAPAWPAGAQLGLPRVRICPQLTQMKTAQVAGTWAKFNRLTYWMPTKWASLVAAHVCPAGGKLGLGFIGEH